MVFSCFISKQNLFMSSRFLGSPYATVESSISFLVVLRFPRSLFAYAGRLLQVVGDKFRFVQRRRFPGALCGGKLDKFLVNSTVYLVPCSLLLIQCIAIIPAVINRRNLSILRPFFPKLCF